MGSIVLRDALRAFAAELAARAAALMDEDSTLSMVDAMAAALAEVKRRQFGEKPK